jgi:hypothetical protein
MLQHPDDDRILDLVLELLPRGDEEEILDHLSCCPACERRMCEFAADKERLLSAAVPSTLDSSGSATFVAPAASAARSPRPTFPGRSPASATARRGRGETGTRKVVRILLPAGGLLALIAMLVIFVMPRERLSGVELKANWLPSGAALLQRGDSSQNLHAGPLAEGIEAYNRRDLDEAVRSLASAEVPRELEPFRCLYLASALTMSGQHARAVRILRPVAMEYLPEPWATEGEWTLLVALRGAGMTSSADSLSVVLRGRSGEIGDRVRKLSR